MTWNGWPSSPKCSLALNRRRQLDRTGTGGRVLVQPPQDGEALLPHDDVRRSRNQPVVVSVGVAERHVRGVQDRAAIHASPPTRLVGASLLPRVEGRGW